MIGLRRRRGRAGQSALNEWRAQRRRTLRQNWRDWAKLMLAIVAVSVWLAFARGPSQLVAAAVLGAMLILLYVMWALGGDAHSLSWVWGRMGEQQTEDVLEKLDGRWRVEHDLPRARGNWDHVVVGPGGVFLLETKSYRATATVRDDTLYLGRFPFRGSGFRSAAAALSEALAPLVSRRPWVQPVVVIWGEFPQRLHEEEGVTYVSGSAVLDWLCSREETLSDERRDEIATALQRLRQQATV